MVVYPENLDLTIYQGRTFQHVVRWETLPVVYKSITNITQTAPGTITAAGHGLVTGWPVAVTDAVGMVEINAKRDTPSLRDYHAVTVVDTNTVTFNDTSAAGFSPYISGGYLRYNTPKDLSGAVARMDLRDRVGGALLLSLTSPSGGIVVDNTNHTITITVTAAITTLMTYKKAVYDLEVQASDGTVSVLLAGSVTVIPEVTTSV